MKRRLEAFETRAALEERVAEELLTVIADATFARGRAEVIVTGGTVGIGILAAMARSARSATTRWNLVHVWWGDDRYVLAGDPDRNEGQANDALFAHVDIPARNLHRFPADDGTPISDARHVFRARLVEELGEHPRFDVVLNGIGPDGHVASLFPGLPQGNDGDLVIAIENSPKPPPRRLSLTAETLNGGRHVWIVAAGGDKADAIARLMSDYPASQTPATALQGIEETTVWVDREAASKL